MSKDCIRIRGARQNNLKNLNLDLPLNEFIVITGVSGSGKSSLAFDTIYSEGQRRYVETFSPYARQFLDRMDKSQTDSIEGIPPSIAIDQTNPVRTSRSTVGTMTEINDHLKLFFSRFSNLYCKGCGAKVSKDTPESIYEFLDKVFKAEKEKYPTVAVIFAVTIPDNFSQSEVEKYLVSQGYTKVYSKTSKKIEVLQDRLQFSSSNRARMLEDLEEAVKHGRGYVTVCCLSDPNKTYKFSSYLHCANCDISYEKLSASSFSFNSALGACSTCRGFGRTMGIDCHLVIPDENKSLLDGAIKPLQSKSYKKRHQNLIDLALRKGIPIDIPWAELSLEHKEWVWKGEGIERKGLWYGLDRFFSWLEKKSYRMHIRVLLSKYRSYDLCSDCQGSRLKPESLLWRLGSSSDADSLVSASKRFKHSVLKIDDKAFCKLPGLTIHDIMLMPLSSVNDFFSGLKLPDATDEASQLLLQEIRRRLEFLNDVGLGYLTLERQSRTLSGGEIQRINLTTALGTSLVNALFVLDEPSVGLHPRDMSRVVSILHKLRDAGNTLVVVEHDPQVMLAGDKILDLGPGPGSKGGEVIFYGTPHDLLQDKRSVTAKFLRKSRSMGQSGSRVVDNQCSWIKLYGVTQHNLKNIDIRIPLERLVCVTGVSGSGKTTLVQHVLFNALVKLKGTPKDIPGEHRKILGHENVDATVLVDQAPIGRTTRSNPASFVGALDGIRKLFASEPISYERGYTAGTFSFNSGDGRCPTCSGNGFEHIEMQFLSDVYIRCGDCNGERFRPEILDIHIQSANTHQSKSISEVLQMTVSEALEFFDKNSAVSRALTFLELVGLDYIKLGQPVPTLSGGESQRLKLASHLAKSGRRSQGTTLFIFDEPTTGLHFSDIEKLLKAFSVLISKGHSVLVIEHNLDVISNSDWIIDLGPEGGAAGGNIVFTGTLNEIINVSNSYTGQALANSFQHKKKVAAIPLKSLGNDSSGSMIEILNARENNLKNVDVFIPREQFTVITGVSGSGKSTIAFDILFSEGQRRYLESLNAYARQFVQPASRPDVDAVFGIPPTVAIEQRVSRGGWKSTVATLTEVYHFLRLAFVKLGTQYCPDCDVSINDQSLEKIVTEVLSKYREKKVIFLSPLVAGRKGYYTELASWAYKKGFASLRVDGSFLPTSDWPKLDRFREHDIELPLGEIMILPKNEAAIRSAIEQGIKHGDGMVKVFPIDDRKKRSELFSTKRACPKCNRSFNTLDPRFFSYNSKYGWCQNCSGTGVEPDVQSVERYEDDLDLANAGGLDLEKCCLCSGHRLKQESLAVRWQGKSISDYTALTVTDALNNFENQQLSDREYQIAGDVFAELRSRLEFMQHVGLGYLSLDRAAPTLSGGEAQRIRLAAQLGSNLKGVCYILDEPTIGLHPRDNILLLDTLNKLTTDGNTVVVVEHDEETIRNADYLIDLGPEAGIKGGKVVAAGTLQDILSSSDSVTGHLIANPTQHPIKGKRRQTQSSKFEHIKLLGVKKHNLYGIDVEIPLRALTCVTGVSGSGKSTLIRDVLFENLKRVLAHPKDNKAIINCKSLDGWNSVDSILEVDQTPIGKTPRSCPATYIGIWDEVRKLFSLTSESRMRGYGPGRFSFNVAGGRCDHCEGQGLKKIAMSFLPDVRLCCDRCNGDRFNEETLEIKYRGLNVGEVLRMSVDEAVEFFVAQPKIAYSMQLLQDVGLGYLSLGQHSPTLSGGEAQRIKLVAELAKTRPRLERFGKPNHHVLYVLDEPTIGLHMADVEKLTEVMHRLVDAGNTVIVIEHNLDIIAEADWIVDMGPEGGDAGGKIVANGSPEQIMRRKRGSHTAKALLSFTELRG
tara:strand:+ start:8554 stop:14070 length:5517 start_codon:yes stop_codon:yes gene_type:complete